MSGIFSSRTQSYEIRLLSAGGKSRLFSATVATDYEAAEQAKRLLLRHSDCENAEVWCGMRLVRQL